MLKLCRKHRLLSALVYMFTRGLQDYTAPAVELLMAELTDPIDASTAGGQDNQTAGPAGASGAADPETGVDAYKLLVYLRCCLRGQQFPPGAGPLPGPQAGITKAATLGTSSDTVCELRCWCTLSRSNAAYAHSWLWHAGFMLYAESEMIYQSWRAFGGGDEVRAGAVAEQLPGAVDGSCALTLISHAASRAGCSSIEMLQFPCSFIFGVQPEPHKAVMH